MEWLNTAKPPSSLPSCQYGFYHTQIVNYWARYTPLHGSLLHSVNGTENKSYYVMKALKKNNKNKLKSEKNSTDKNACHSMNSVVCGCYHAYNCCCDSNSPLALCISDNCISGSENMYN